MSFALIASTSASSGTGTGVSTTAINTTGANLIVVVLASSFNAGEAITDSVGNTFIVADTRTSSLFTETIYYCYNPITSATYTVSSGAIANTFPAIVVTAFSGSASSPLDQVTGGTTNVAGPITPTLANELIITGYTSNTTITPAATGIATVISRAMVSAFAIAVGLGYTIQTTATAVTATWTSSTIQASSIVSFKSASASGGSSFEPPLSANMNGHVTGGMQG